jgi:hypothetical protein
VITPIATATADPVDDTTPVSAGAAASAVLVCRRCALRLRPHVRQGWLRASSVRWHNRHDHPG